MNLQYSLGDYYHMMIMNENINWMKQTHKLPFSFSLNLGAPLGTSTCTPNFFTSTLNLYI